MHDYLLTRHMYVFLIFFWVQKKNIALKEESD